MDLRSVSLVILVFSLYCKSGHAQYSRIFLERLERQMRFTIETTAASTPVDSLARAMAREVDAMEDDLSRKRAWSLPVFFSVVAWKAEIPTRYRARVITGDIIEMNVRNYGRRPASNGIVSFPGCAEERSPWRVTPIGDLGWPCFLGGAGTVTEADRGGIWWNSMVVFLPNADLRSGEVPGGGRSHPPVHALRKFMASVDRCKETQRGAVQVKLTAMAHCIYMNYPKVWEEYPPRDHRSSGFRLRGTAVVPGGENEEMPRELGTWLPYGFLVISHFDVLMDMNETPLTLTVAAGVLRVL